VGIVTAEGTRVTPSELKTWIVYGYTHRRNCGRNVGINLRFGMSRAETNPVRLMAVRKVLGHYDKRRRPRQRRCKVNCP
jgi:hypothetical protein